jgi:DNA-binding response OmpR family regulator
MQHTAERILLVDGSVDEREMYAEYLQLLGFCTLQADNAADGYRLAMEMAPAIVITAVRLPGDEDGLALTRRLRGHVDTQDAAVIMLSSSSAERYRALAARAGCDRFVMMPCLPDRLGVTVQELLWKAHSNVT